MCSEASWSIVSCSHRVNVMVLNWDSELLSRSRTETVSYCLSPELSCLSPELRQSVIVSVQNWDSRSLSQSRTETCQLGTCLGPELRQLVIVSVQNWDGSPTEVQHSQPHFLHHRTHVKNITYGSYHKHFRFNNQNIDNGWQIIG